MGKTIQIYEYSKLSDAELMSEAQRLRYEVEHPKLSFRDHTTNLFLSIVGAGTTVSTVVGLGYMLARPPQKDFSIKNLNQFLGLYFKGPKEEYKSFRQENPDFVNSLLATVSSFALATAISVPLINKFQRKEMAEDNATRLSHAERILAERGYEPEVKTLTR